MRRKRRRTPRFSGQGTIPPLSDSKALEGAKKERLHNYNLFRETQFLLFFRHFSPCLTNKTIAARRGATSRQKENSCGLTSGLKRASFSKCALSSVWDCLLSVEWSTCSPRFTTNTLVRRTSCLHAINLKNYDTWAERTQENARHEDIFSFSRQFDHNEQLHS